MLVDERNRAVALGDDPGQVPDWSDLEPSGLPLAQGRLLVGRDR